MITQPNGKQYRDGKLSSRLGTGMKRLKLQEKNPNISMKGKPLEIGYNDMRHSFVSYFRGKEKGNKQQINAQRKKIAKAMLHSVGMQGKYDRVLNHYLEEDLAKIFFEYGDLRNSKRIANHHDGRCIERARIRC